MNPGVYQMDRVQYDLLPHYNQSLIKRWIKLGDIPSEFAFWHNHRSEQEESDSLRLGRALDCLKLCGAIEFANRFIAIPDDAPKKPTKAQLRAKKPSKETVEAIAYWDTFNQSANGKTILSLDEYLCVGNMSASLSQSDSVHGVFEHCKKAVLVAKIFGFDCKGEIDLWSEKTEHIGDLKALKDVSPKGFADAFFTFGYDIQSVFYLALARALGFEKRIFDFHCVKNSPPYTVKTHSFAPYENAEHSQIAAFVSAKIGNAIYELDRRLKINDFADDQDWKLIEIPRWQLRQAQMEMDVVA